MGFKAYTGRLINFLSSNEFEYFPLGILILDREGNIINYGDSRVLREQYKEKISECLDFGEGIIIPGFVETHIHLPHLALQIEEENLEKWLRVMNEEEEKITKDEAKITVRESLEYLISNGITTACIHAFYSKETTEFVFEEARRRGLRAIIGMVMVDTDPHLPEGLKKLPDQAINEAKEIINEWHKPDEGRYYALTPRSAWSCSPALLKGIKQIKEEYPSCYIQTHLGECPWVLKKVKENWDKGSDTEYFDENGILSSNTIVAHGVYLTPEEKKILKDKSVGISYNPATDLVTLKNEDGYFKLDDLLKEGIHIGLGVDEPWKFPVFNVMRKASQIQKEKKGGEYPASLFFYLYTLGGAKALGLDKICGNFEKDKKGDFMVLQTS